MPTTVLSPLPVQKFFSNNGEPLVGGLLFTYAAGTTNKIATYTDASGLSSNTNPVVLDYRGECNVWLDPTLAYKFVLSPAGDTDPPTSPIWTEDDIAGGLTITILTQQFLGQIIWPRTPSEFAAGVTPLNYAVPANYLIRYLVTFISDVTDCTSAVQDLLAVLRLSGEDGILPGGIARYSSTASFDTDGLSLTGNSTVRSALKKVGNFVGMTITADCSLKNFTLDSDGTPDASAGVTIRDQARVTMRDVIVQSQGSHGLWIQQTSLSLFENIQAVSNAGDGVRLDASVPPLSSNSFVIGNTFQTIDTRGNGGVGFNMLNTAFSNFCNAVVSQNNVGNGIVLANARANYILGYAEANGGDEWVLTSDADCRGNTLYSLEGSIVDNSPSGGIYNTLWAANRAGTYDQYAKRIAVMNLIIPEDAFDGNQYQGTLSLKHTANRQFDIILNGFAGSQSVRYVNAQSGGVDVIANTFSAPFYYFNNSPANNFITSGTGSPNSVVTAPVGSLFMRTDGGAGSTLYVKETGAGNTGWVGK